MKESSSASICASQESKVENSDPKKIAKLQASNHCSGDLSYKGNGLRVQECGTPGPQQRN
jgi:hypothetical protein